jgi:nucleoside-diphosphate-sugar epimerase
VRALLRAGHQVVAVGRSHPHVPDVEFIEADLLNARQTDDAVRQAGASHLMHLAWDISHRDFWTSSLNHGWVTATGRLAHAFLAHGGTRIVGAGSCAEYAPAHLVSLKETDPIAPTTLYGQAKVEACRRVADACRARGASWAWGRIFIPYGPGDAPNRLIPSLFDVFLRRWPPFPVNVDDVRDFIHADDVASGMVALMEGSATGPANVATGIPTSIARVVSEVARACGRHADEILLEPPRGGPARGQGTGLWLVGEPATLHQLGWQPRWTLADAFRQMANEYRASC